MVGVHKHTDEVLHIQGHINRQADIMAMAVRAVTENDGRDPFTKDFKRLCRNCSTIGEMLEFALNNPRIPFDGETGPWVLHASSRTINYVPYVSPVTRKYKSVTLADIRAAWEHDTREYEPACRWERPKYQGPVHPDIPTTVHYLSDSAFGRAHEDGQHDEHIWLDEVFESIGTTVENITEPTSYTPEQAVETDAWNNLHIRSIDAEHDMYPQEHCDDENAFMNNMTWVRLWKYVMENYDYMMRDDDTYETYLAMTPFRAFIVKPDRQTTLQDLLEAAFALLKKHWSQEYEYHVSEERFYESACANEWLFDEDGWFCS